MNTSRIKAYAPKARRDFIKAVTERANLLGITHNHIEPCEIKGDVAIIGGQPFPKRVGELRDEIIRRMRRTSFNEVMEEAAYTWFNRFAALRYMEIHDYLDHGYRVLSNRSGSDVPEILENAADIDIPGLDREKVIELRLAGNRDDELYRLLIIAQCNSLHDAMPFLFGRIDDALKLLLPANLLHSSGLVRKLVSSIPEEDWQNVEIIGWLYQFYIKEKKDQVIGKVIKSEDIPAATQLFTPNWIVRYMIQNSLGRLWLSAYPDSLLKERMEYYIGDGEQREDVKEELLKSAPSSLDPEGIRVLDPACGSGHILLEAYNILKDIYLERGYRTRDIPGLILTKNLFGLDIDDRAAQLAAFCLMMRARADDRRIFGRAIRPNVFSIQESRGNDWDEVIKAVLAKGKKKFLSGQGVQGELFPTAVQKNLELKEKEEVRPRDIEALLRLFKFGKTFGSLIRVPDEIAERLPAIREKIEWCLKEGSQLSREYADRLFPFVRQAELLSRKYDVVVANPPYMGSKGMNAALKKFAKKEYPDSKSDLFAMFIERNLDLAKSSGFVAMITMQSWMFLSSFEKLREKILNSATITSMAHLGPRAFDTIGGEVVSTTSFVLENSHRPKYKGAFIRLVDGQSEAEKALMLKEAVRQQ